MVKARAMMNLDGDFSKDFPTPQRFTQRMGDEWTVVERGPSYVNTYAVTEFDASGLAWLEKHLLGGNVTGGSDSPPPAQPSLGL